MTSFKKPLIAIASAVALVTTALVATPANAAVSAVVSVGTVSTDVATAAQVLTTPLTPTVPSDNKVDAADTVKFVVTVPANTVVTATATDAKIVKTLDATDAPVTSASGSTSFSDNSGSGLTVTFYAFTTKTTTGSVVVTTGGSSSTYYLKGLAGPAYTLAVSAPTSAGLSGTADLTATVVDIFGNSVVDASVTTTVIRGTVKANNVSATANAFVYDSTDKRYEAVLTAPATAGTTVIASSIALATAVAGFAKPVAEVITNVTVADLATQVTTLSADVAAKTAEIASLKAKFNALAKKYNTKVAKKYQVKTIK